MALRQARNRTYLVGVIEIVARDREVLHALRDAKSAVASITATQRALTAEELAQLPRLLRESVAILLDEVDEALLYIVNASSRREAAKIIVR